MYGQGDYGRRKSKIPLRGNSLWGGNNIILGKRKELSNAARALARQPGAC